MSSAEPSAAAAAVAAAGSKPLRQPAPSSQQQARRRQQQELAAHRQHEGCRPGLLVTSGNWQAAACVSCQANLAAAAAAGVVHTRLPLGPAPEGHCWQCTCDSTASALGGAVAAQAVVGAAGSSSCSCALIQALAAEGPEPVSAADVQGVGRQLLSLNRKA